MEIASFRIQVYSSDPWKYKYGGGFTHRLKDSIVTSSLMTNLLMCFGERPFNKQLAEEGFNVSLNRLRTTVQKVAKDLQPISGTDVIQVSEKVVFSSLKRLKLTKKDVKRVYSTISMASRSVITSTESPEGVLRLIDLLLQNMDEMMSYKLGIKEQKRKKKFFLVQRLRTKKKVGLIVALREKIQALQDELRFLRYFLCFRLRKLEKMEFYSHVDALAIKVACFLCLCLMDDDRADEKLVAAMKNELLDLLGKLTALQHQIRHIYLRTVQNYLFLESREPPYKDGYVLGFVDSLMEYLVHNMSDKNAGFIVADRDHLEILIQEWSFLRYDIIAPALISVYDNVVLPTTQGAVMELGYLIYLSRDGKRDEAMTQKVLARFFHLIELVNDITEISDGFIPKPWQLNFPSLNELGSVDIIVNNLKELLQDKAVPIEKLKLPIETVYKLMVSVRECFTENADLCNENSSMKALLSRFKDVAYHVEFVVDSSVMNHLDNISYYFICLLDVQIKVKIIRQEVKAIVEITRETINKNHNNAPQASSSHVSSQAGDPPNMDAVAASKDEVKIEEEEFMDGLVGLQDARMEVQEHLTRGSAQLKIVSIVGMPGLGKTTLANSLYRSPWINIHFHVHAWCCISQAYDKETLLLDIYDQIVGKTKQRGKIYEDVAQKLYQSLKGRRYLIVMDDIWDIEAWNNLKGIFPDDDNGSRILFTTRNRAVALKANAVPYDLRLLSKDESFELLQLELFEDKTCPAEFRVIGKHIAGSCRGLPLSVVLIAGVLKRTERKRESWEKVVETLIRSDEVDDILEFSYKNLPDYLKPCFLYFAAFPEDTTISVSKLIRLWMSEGFVEQQSLGQKSLDQEAELYLNDLIDRSLVMIAERSSRGGVKKCRVHDLLRDFCLAKADKECFLLHEKRYEQVKLHKKDSKHLKQYRLCITSRVEETWVNGNSPLINRLGSYSAFEAGNYWGLSPRIRSLLYYYKSNRRMKFKAADDFYEDVVYDSLSIAGTRLIYTPLLRVLDLANVHFRNRADTADLKLISRLVHLRYIAILVRTNEIPKEFGNLRKLETFLLSGAIGKVTLPEAFWYLPTLRHVHTTNQAFFSFQHDSKEFLKRFHRLESLKTLSMPSLCCGDDEKILRWLPNLQKLKCRFLNSWDDSTNCSRFPALNFLTQLESLKVFFSGKVLYPCTFHFPPCLKKLSLSNFRLPWDKISVILRALHNLEVLKLLNRACEGKEWCMKEDALKKLRFLKLDSLDIEVWDASGENFPSLEQLVVVGCGHLQEIPSAIGEIPTLELIEMKWCSSSATDSVKKILEDQREWSNDQLKVFVVGP